MRFRQLLVVALLAPALPAEAKPSPGKLACKKDADCGVLPALCFRCDPCEKTWRPAANQVEIRGIEAARRVASCPARLCEACSAPDNWVGDRAICRAGRCAMAQIAPELAEKALACKRDEDCALSPRSPCACPSCGVEVPAAVSRSVAEALSRSYAVGGCRRGRCPACKSPPRTLPGQAICRAGRCLLTPR